MFKRTITLAAIFGMVALAPPLAGAAAQPVCGDREAIVKKISKTYGEARIGGGLQNQDAIFEIWVSANSEGWTITRTQTNGVTCVMATGTNWTEFKPVTGVAS